MVADSVCHVVVELVVVVEEGVVGVVMVRAVANLVEHDGCGGEWVHAVRIRRVSTTRYGHGMGMQVRERCRGGGEC